MIIEIFHNILYLLQFIIVAILCFRLEYKRNNKIIIVLGLSIIVITIILNYIDNALFQFPITFLYILFVNCYLFDEKRIYLLLYSIAMVTTFSMLNMMIDILTLCIINLIDNTLEVEIHDTYTLIVSLLFLLVIGNIANKWIGKRRVVIDWKYILFFAILLIVDCIVVVSLGDLALNDFKESTLYNISYILVVIGIFIQITMVIWFMLSRDVYREKEMITRRHLESQVEHYRYLENRERETKKFRHDIRSHMQMLGILYQEQNNEAFKQYIEEINGRVDQFAAHILVGNGIVDAMLNKYYDEAQQKGICIKVEGRFPADCKVSAYDLCTIFSNLLTNAIRAEEDYHGKEIDVLCKYTDTDILIVVENDYTQIKKDGNGRLQTSKEDDANHGFGLEIVEECVERNHGQMDIQIEQNRFRVILSLKNGVRL